MPFIKTPLCKPWIGEEEAEAAKRVVASGWLIFGPEVEAFEKEFAAMLGVKHAIAVNSGSSALLVAMAALGLRPGDEIIAPNMTFVSTASAAMYLGGKPFFTDITMDDYGMDPESLERAITPKTKIIVPVHYAGQTASMERILQIAKTRGIPVLEDAAEAHLAKYNNRYAGTLGSIGIFSFTPSKPMTTGEGGMIVTNDDELAKKSRLVRNFGDTDKFRWDVLGFNFRMPEVMGAIGRIQLKKLAECVRIRRKIAQAYSEAFAGLEGLVVPYVRRAEDHNFQLYTLRVDSSRFTVGRDQWISELAKRGISARLYYPTLADQAVFSALDGAKVSFKNASLFAQTAFSLPIFPTMTDDQLNQVIEGVRTIHQTLKATR